MTTQYCRDRKAFGRSIMDFQNTRFKLAEARTEATLARVFVEKCAEPLLINKLDATTTTSKYWITDNWPRHNGLLDSQHEHNTQHSRPAYWLCRS